MLTLTDDPFTAVLSPPSPAGPLAERMRFALHYAVLAPSLHNSQPWRFRLADRPPTVDLLADLGREVPLLDPTGRQLLISCGAALLNLRLGLSSLHLAAEVDLLPDPAAVDHLARIRVAPGSGPAPEDLPLIAALPTRRTSRQPFQDRLLPATLEGALLEAAEREGAHLRFVALRGIRRSVAYLVGVADRTQAADPDLQAELRQWTRTSPRRAADGVPERAFGRDELGALLAPFPMRNFAGGRPVLDLPEFPPHEPEPMVVVLWTDEDRPVDWLRAGQALQRLLLVAAAAGVHGSYLNQPTELPALRRELRDELNLPGHPQLLLRLGYPASPDPVQPPPRRPVADALVFTGGSRPGRSLR